MSTGNWFAERRLDYIDFRLLTAGSIQRADIIRTFGVSMPQASADLNRFLDLYPESLVYDKSAKCYTPAKKYKTHRGITPTTITAFVLLRAVGSPIGWE